MKKNVIINFFTLSITALLLVLVVMAWYVTNSDVTADGIFGSTSSDSFTLELERGEYDDVTGWTWESTKSLSISNMQPGSSFFFRFKVNADKAGKFKTVFNDVQSAIDPTSLVEKITVSDVNYVSLNGLRLFKMNQNNVPVKVKDGNNITTKNLYTYSERQVEDSQTSQMVTIGEFSLADFKVEDTFLFYDYGLGDEIFSNDNDVTNDGTNSYTVVKNDASLENSYYGSLTSNTYYVKNSDDTYSFATGKFDNDETYYTFDSDYEEAEDLSSETYYTKMESSRFYKKSGNNYVKATGDYSSSTVYYSKASASYSRPLVGTTTEYQMTSSGIKYAYFALEFNNELSLVNYLHAGYEENNEQGYKIDSNLYQAQILSIKKIGLEEVR